MIRNLNTVLDTTVKHQRQFDETRRRLREADHRPEEPGRPDRHVRSPDISDAAGTVDDLLADNRRRCCRARSP